MIGRTLRLAKDRRMVVRYAILLAASALVRAASVLSLVPLLGALFSPEPGAAVPWIGALVVLVAAGWAIDYAVAGAGFTIGFELLTGMEKRLLDRLHRIPLGWFTAERRADGQRALTSAGRELCQGISHLVTPAVNALVMPALVGVGLLFVAWPLGLMALAAVPVLLLALWGSSRCLRAADDAYASASNEAGQRILEVVRAQPALRVAGRAGTDKSAIGEALDRQRSAALCLIGFGLPGHVMFGFAAQAVLLGLAVTAVVLGINGELSSAEVIALVVVTVRFVEPFTTLAELSPALQAMRGTLARIHALLDAPIMEGNRAEVTPDHDAPALELADVRFAYGAVGDDRAVEHSRSRPVDNTIDGVSFTVARGSTTAIVGASGAGKSTLLALIARFRALSNEAGDSGSIRIAGHDVRDYDPTVLMNQLGIVFQDVYLFDGSLRENVLLGNPAASDAQLDAIATAAQLHEVVRRLPDGWGSKVGDRGATLSGGERQRVSIARALLKNAPLLLLDEATAALDAANERAIIGALEAGRGERATVIVAHRLSTIARADQILFLEAGRIIESGTLSELLVLEGRFATYWHQREKSADWTLTPR